MNSFFALGAVTNLLSYSWLHTNYTVTDIHRRIVPPLELGQHCMIWNGDFLVAFGSYAWLDDEAHEAMKTNTMEWGRQHWKSGDHLWLVDVVAPWGHGRQVCSTLRAKVRDEGHEGIKVNFRRRYLVDDSRRVSEARL